MANYISVDKFIEDTINVGVDYDNRYGIQCVDGIKYFTYLIYGEANFNCGNVNYAYGLWTNFKNNGCSKYFVQYPFKDVQPGDWVIWNKNSLSSPNSHVGMYVSKVSDNTIKIWGEAAGRGFNYDEVNTNGILGVLRPKIYNEENIIEEYLKPRGDFRKGDNNSKIKKICEWFSANKLVGTYFGEYLEAIVKVYQKEKGRKKVGPADGGIGKKTLSAMVEDGYKL